MQTKKLSLIESIINTAIGFLVSFGIQLLIYPLLNIPVTFAQNIFITAIFTIISIARGYFVRRIFNHLK